MSRSFLALAATLLLLPAPGAADILHLDDVIIEFSLCVGNDCVSGEGFGFDTVRLKENNLRIHFQDTSTSASFPTNDWRIVVNDSSNGGANYWAIEDSSAARQPFRIEAGAPNNALYVDDGGRIGVGTNNPVVELHVVDGNTPTLRLEQNGSQGFSAQTWDLAGNEANFFIRDATNGSRLVFRIRPGAPTSGISMHADGDIGFGTDSPLHDLHFHETSGNDVQLKLTHQGSGQTDSDGANFSLVNNDLFITNREVGTTQFFVGAAQRLRLGNLAGEEVRLPNVTNCASGIQSDAQGDLSCLTSSRRFKNIAGPLPVEVSLANVMALRPHSGSYKATPDVPEHWLIAEEVAEVDPALVGLKDGEPYTVKIQGVVTDLVNVVQEQQRLMEEQQRRIEELERKLAGD